MIQEGKEYLNEEGYKTLQESKNQIEEGDKDWFAYRGSYPLQTLILGMIKLSCAQKSFKKITFTKKVFTTYRLKIKIMAFKMKNYSYHY